MFLWLNNFREGLKRLTQSLRCRIDYFIQRGKKENNNFIKETTWPFIQSYITWLTHDL